jgi:putative intracellular protease/amidase
MTATLDRTTTKPKRVLMVVANPTTSTTTGWPVGFWASELFHPLYEFAEAGYDVTIASPEGGAVEIDGMSDPRDESRYSAEDVLSLGYLSSDEHTAALQDTPRLADLDPEDFDAIVVCGGQGPMFGFRENHDLQAALRAFYEAEKPTAALCHGVSALVDVRLADGSYLVDGRTVTGFANVEERAADAAAGTKIMPWHIEDALRERGANYVEGGLWKPFAVRDGRLITGQQQYSGRKVAALLIEALGV